MNRNDRRNSHPLGTTYLVGEGRPIPVRVIGTMPATSERPAKALIRILEDGAERIVPRDWISREPLRFNRNSPARRFRRAIATIIGTAGGTK